MSRTVLVVGGGGREHALCLALSSSASIVEIHTRLAMQGRNITVPITMLQLQISQAWSISQSNWMLILLLSGLRRRCVMV